jgi:hypothetical protein
MPALSTPQFVDSVSSSLQQRVPALRPREEDISHDLSSSLTISCLNLAIRCLWLNFSIGIGIGIGFNFPGASLLCFQARAVFKNWKRHGCGDFVGDLMDYNSQQRPLVAWSKLAYLISIMVAKLINPKLERQN